MKNLLAIIFNCIKSKAITQDFKLEGYNHRIDIPFTDKYSIWFKGIRPTIRYTGPEWENNRNEFMIALHGMTYAEMQLPENEHLFVARISNYAYSS